MARASVKLGKPGDLTTDTLSILTPVQSEVDTNANDYSADDSKTAAIYSSFNALHPDVRNSLLPALRELDKQNIAIDLSPDSASPLNQYGLAFTLTTTEADKAAQAKAALEKAGFVATSDGHYATTDNPAEANIIAQLSTVHVGGRSNTWPQTGHSFPVIPGGYLWNQQHDSEQGLRALARNTANLTDKLGITFDANGNPVLGPAAKPADKQTDKPTDGKDTAATEPAKADKPATPAIAFKPNSEKHTAEDWTTNGLLGLGVIKSDMTADAAKAATEKYLKDSGATDLGAQVAKDVTTWQSYLKQASVPKTISTTTTTEIKSYDIGSFGAKKDGVDGKFGDVTLTASTQYSNESGIKNPLDIVRAIDAKQAAATPAPELTETQRLAAATESFRKAGQQMPSLPVAETKGPDGIVASNSAKPAEVHAGRNT